MKMANKKINPTEKAYQAWVDSICKSLYLKLYNLALSVGKTDVKPVVKDLETMFGSPMH